MKLIWTLVVALSFIGLVKCARKLPNYIKPCRRSNFPTCAVAAGQAAVSKLVRGDPSINLPVMDPLRVKRIEIKDDGKQKYRLSINLTNVAITGLKSTKVVNVTLTDVGPVLRMTVSDRMDRLVIKSDYSVNGQVLVLPITGTGPCEFTLEQPSFTFVLDGKPRKKNGVVHLELLNILYYHNLKNMTIRLDNLFNGNKLLGDNMNQVLNENWEGLNEQMGSFVLGAIVDKMKPFLIALLEEIPYNQLVL